jgi:hypothetical protein
MHSRSYLPAPRSGAGKASKQGLIAPVVNAALWQNNAPQASQQSDNSFNTLRKCDVPAPGSIWTSKMALADRQSHAKVVVLRQVEEETGHEC